MLLSALSEANEVVDRHYRQTALGVYNSLYRIISDSYRTSGDWPKRVTEIQFPHIYAIRLPLSIFPMEFQADLHGARDVVFLFSNEATVGTGAQGKYARLMAGRVPIIFLTVMSDVEARQYPPGEFPITKVLERMKKNRSTMIHEIVHWMDDNRYNLEKDGSSSKAAQDLMDGSTDDPTDYYNSDNEWNAHYQELVSTVEDDIRNQRVLFNPEMSNIEKLTSGFGMFYRGIRAMYGKRFQFLQYLTPKTERRFRKRLYNFYKETALPMIQDEDFT